MIRRELHPTGLRLVTEAMPHVRSVSIGVWLTRGSRHESDARSGIAHFVEHMLFKGTEGRSAEDIAQEIDSVGGHLDAFTSKEYAGYYIKVLDEHLPKAVDLLADIVRRPRFAPDDIEKREEGDPRRDQDGRGHARRSGPRDPDRAVLARPPARTPDPRRAVDGRGAVGEGPHRLLLRDLRRLELHRLGRRQPRSRPAVGAASPRPSAACARRGPAVNGAGPGRQRRRRPSARRTSSRATSAIAYARLSAEPRRSLRQPTS